jgi:signal transduction histidine kinase/CheY-like chemotaxis protein
MKLPALAKVLLEALDRPAVLVGPGGEAHPNAAFEALPAAVRARALSKSPPPGWSGQPVPGDLTLIVSAGAGATPERMQSFARERALATLSHEIRTPLNGVLGMAGLLARTKLNATQAAYVQALTDSGDHLLGLVNDVLDYAKLGAGKIALESQPTDLERLLQGVAELLSPRAHAAHIDIAWAATPALPPILADEGRLRQILFNLAGNAVKMTSSGGVLLTAEELRRGEGRIIVRFGVKDTGPGLGSEAQARIFEAFEQTTEGVRAGGAGLGLAIVRSLAQAFGGEVGVFSRPGEGALFWFQASFETAAAEVSVGKLRGLCVAIASGSAVVREAARRQVEASGGQGLTFATPDDAARQAPRDAILLVDPPDRAQPSAPPPRRQAIVLLTPEARDSVDAWRAVGYAGYLIKPLRRASLEARVLAAADRGAAVAPLPDAEAGGFDERAEVAFARGMKVLLAEDNPVNAMLAAALLKREGCVTDRVTTGEEAVRAADEGRGGHDLILMDVRMPGMDGIAATRVLRAQGVRTPILALTADAFEDDRRACLEAGMDDFLTKPLNAAALRAALGRWTLGRRETVRARAAS